MHRERFPCVTITPARHAFVQAIGFFRRHWLHVLISPILAITVITFLHEAAHALAAWLQGGTVTSFTIVPTERYYGQMSYRFPAGARYSPALISLAPYLLWGGIAGVTAILARCLSIPRWAAPTLFLWCYAAPILDIAKACAEFLLGQPSDLTHAFGVATEVDWASVLLLGGLTYVLSYFVQRRLYGQRDALSPAGYLGTSVLAIGLICLALAAAKEVAPYLSRL